MNRFAVTVLFLFIIVIGGLVTLSMVEVDIPQKQITKTLTLSEMQPATNGQAQ